MSTVRVGVIGAGAIAPSHCRGVKAHANAELAGIADQDEGRAKEIQKQFGIPEAYATYQDIIARPDIDAVSIALPTYLHAQVALAALEAGKHVLLDKPFAMNFGEAEQVVETAKKHKRVFTVGMNQRFTDNAQTVRALVERRALGEIYHAEAYWCRRSGAPRFGTWFGDKSRAGGGSLLDIGVHVLDLTLSLMGNFTPVSVSGAAYTKFGHRGLGEGGWGKSDIEEKKFDVDDFAAAFIKLAGGATVILKASWARHQAEANHHNVELFGTEGGAQVFPPRFFRFSSVRGEYEVIETQNVRMRHPAADRMVNWIDAILGEDELEVPPEQSLAVQRIIDAVYESSTTGKEVRI